MRQLILALALFVYHLDYAQVVPVQGVPLNPIDQSIFSQWASEVDSETSGLVIVGSPYLFDDWTKGELTTIKGDQYTDVDLKLNLFTDQIIYRNPFTKDSTLILSKFLTSYKLQNKDTVFTFYYIPPKPDQKSKVRSGDFYLILLDDKNALLGRPDVKIKRATKNSMINSDGQIKDRFSRTNEFYLRDESGKISRIKLSKKAFIKALQGFQEELKEYIKENKSDLSNPNHLIAVVSYYNSLF